MHTAPMDVEISGLTKAYGSTLAVQNMSCSIRKGEMVAFLGPSGCGKTTALRMIAGLVRPTSGEISIGGTPISGLPIHRRNIGMLFQSYALFPHLSVAQNIAFGLEARKLPRAEIGRRVDEGMRLTRLESFSNRLPAALSGGQQQRVALARALVIEPNVLLLDEPLGALDKNLREAMQTELRQIQQRLGITSIIVTHDQDEAMTLADRIVIMRGGRLEQVGTPEEIYGDPRTRFVAEFLGTANFMRGPVMGVSAGIATLDIGGHAVRVPASEGPTSGSPTLFLRPEDIIVRLPRQGTQPDDADRNALPATVEKVGFRGPVTTIHLALPHGGSIVALRKNRRDLADIPEAGQTVVASWRVSSGKLLGEDG